MSESIAEELEFSEDGLIPAIAQDINTGEIRMLAYMNEKAFKKTLDTGLAHYWSRSRDELWKKGETSGHTQEVTSVRTDCDRDTILLLIEQDGEACHTGERNCFFREWDFDDDSWTDIDPLPVDHLGSLLGEIGQIVEQRDQNRPDGSYTTHLLEGESDKSGQDLILEKIGEEVTELLIASKNENKENLLQECGDLLYHLIVLLQKHDISQTSLAQSLNDRRTQQ